ncbi:MAG: hypothetical protein OXC46_08705 [Thaumarchaeota archaeon]|nr:hypothetical protein [Nitrososphaerota archaeon]
MRYVSPTRLKVLMMMFFSTGIMGMIIGLVIAPPQATVMITFMGVINISLGAFFVWMFLTQKPKEPDKRKKKRKDV